MKRKTRGKEKTKDKKHKKDGQKIKEEKKKTRGPLKTKRKRNFFKVDWKIRDEKINGESIEKKRRFHKQETKKQNDTT